MSETNAEGRNPSEEAEERPRDTNAAQADPDSTAGAGDEAAGDAEEELEADGPVREDPEPLAP